KPMSPCGRPLALIVELGHSTVPEEGAPSPAMMRSAVDLPQPEGPSRLRNSPGSTVSDMLESANVPLENTFETPCMVTTGRALDVDAADGVALEVSISAKRSFVPK